MRVRRWTDDCPTLIVLSGDCRGARPCAPTDMAGVMRCSYNRAINSPRWKVFAPIHSRIAATTHTIKPMIRIISVLK